MVIHLFGSAHFRGRLPAFFQKQIVDIGDDKSQSSPLNNVVLDFRYVALFQNQDHSKATGVENRANFARFEPL